MVHVKYCWSGLCLFLATVLSSSANQLGTLRTFQRHACDGSNLVLSCPNNTSIDIFHANYGDASLSEKMASRCPISDNRRSVDITGQGCNFSSLEYSTTERIVAMCHSKRHCNIPVKASTFTKSEPCPHHAKYLEVAFRCRPAIFINKIICEEDTLYLKCNSRAKIAIYSVFFGRTKDGSLECPQNLGVPEGDCQASFASEIVMKQCHGFHSCAVKASAEVFGTPCPKDYKMYMKAVYTCVPSIILKPILGHNDTPAGPLADGDVTLSNNEIGSTVLPAKQNDSGSPSRPGQHKDRDDRKLVSNDDLINCTVTILSGADEVEVGLITNWMRIVSFVDKNFDLFILYFVVGACVGALLCLIALVIHLWRGRDKERKKRAAHDQLTSTFSADLDDMEGDIDLMGPSGTSSANGYSPTPPHPVVDQDAVRYYSSPRPAALRCNDTDLILPRSLSRENHQFLYS